MQEGLDQGKRSDLTGGGLVRSLGGWTEVKRKGKSVRVKGDEQILGSSDFATKVSAEANEPFDRKYKLRSKGFDFKKPRKNIVEARSLIRYFAVRELGMSLTSIANEWGSCLSSVGYAVLRGEKIVDAEKYHLTF